ncbi:hypothetical protein, partial [Salmonella enterica]|uniref:hypothetical protein n=1 Tax=Salmonella enterica TaxID=28901 RepID=UPI001F1E4098
MAKVGEARRTCLALKPKPVAISRLKSLAWTPLGSFSAQPAPLPEQPMPIARFSPTRIQENRAMTILEYLLTRNSAPIPELKAPAPSDA